MYPYDFGNNFNNFNPYQMGNIAFNIPALLRLSCCKSASTITLQISTTATLPVTVTVNNVGVVIEKI